MTADTGPAKLPALPMVATGNPSLDNLLRAIVERLEVREGSRGNPAERVVTQRELNRLGLLSAGGTPITSAGGVLVKTPGGSYVTVSMTQFAEDIRKTQLYQNLLKKLSDTSRFDAMPEQVRALLLEDIADEAKKRQADILRVDEKLQNTSESLAYSLQEVTAAVEKSASGIREISFASASADSATAGRVTTIEARLDDVGGVTLEETLIASASRVDGLAGEYMIKINAGKAMAGIGIAASEDPEGNLQSVVLIQASKFAFVGDNEIIADPMNPPLNRIPFGYDSASNTIFLNGQVRISAGGPSVVAAISVVRVTASSPWWSVDTAGNPTVPSITLTATLTAPLSGFVTWSRTGSGGTVPTPGSSNTWVIYAADQIADSDVYTATFESDGETYTSSTTLVRVRDGVRGDTGDDGLAGSAGSLNGYGSQYGISSSSWSDALGSRVINNMLTGETLTSGLGSTAHLLIGDTVTLSNSTTFAATRYWGGTGWLVPGVILDGNLLVNGTVSATAIAAGSISTGGGGAVIDIGSNGFAGSYTAAMRMRKINTSGSQIMLAAVNTQDASTSIWGANASGLDNANAVTGTWHRTEADYNATRWTLFGALGSDFMRAGVAGAVYGGDAIRAGGVFAFYNGTSDAGYQTPVNKFTAGSSSRSAIAEGPFQLFGASSSLILQLDAGTSGQVLTSAGEGYTPTWTTPSSGGTTLTYSGLQSVTSGSTGSALELTTTFRVQGRNVPASGAGLEMAYYGGAGFLVAYNRSGGAYIPLDIGGSTISMNVTPTFPTPATGAYDTQGATTAFVKNQGYAAGGHAHSPQTSVSGSSGSVGGYKCFGGSGSGGSYVSFPSAFSSEPGISATSTAGNIACITSASQYGFTVQTYNTGGGATYAPIRWTAVGGA
jgi:hypothetical protein